jgi:hypothetical protein
MRYVGKQGEAKKLGQEKQQVQALSTLRTII